MCPVTEVMMLTAAQRRVVDLIDADLTRLIRYDDESIVAQKWIRQRYDCGCYPSYAPARTAVLRTAWHEAGHAVAALATGARFSSASIHHSPGTEGRVHGIRSDGQASFVIDAAGQLSEQLINWTLIEADAELAGWLRGWRCDGGDARRFRKAMTPRFGTDEIAAWRYSEAMIVPLRPKIRRLARALMVYPRHLPYAVAAALAEN
jgi:Peptidase M50B-like